MVLSGLFGAKQFQVTTPLSKSERWVKGLLLGGAIAPLSGSFLYAAGETVPGLGCPILALTGIPCPTCGMTRAFTALARGQLDQAIAYHLFSPLIFFGFVIAALHLGAELLTRRHLQTPISRGLQHRMLWIVLGSAFMGYYFSRLPDLIQAGI